MRSPEWIAQLSMATAGAPAGGALSAPSPAAGGLGAGALNPSWASPAAVAPLQALYAWYSGNAHRVGGKTNGEGAARRAETPASAGLSGLSSLFDGNFPAEVEAAMHREAMHAAAAAAVQAAMGGVTRARDGATPRCAETPGRGATRRRGGIRVAALTRANATPKHDAERDSERHRFCRDAYYADESVLSCVDSRRAKESVVGEAGREEDEPSGRLRFGETFREDATYDT